MKNVFIFVFVLSTCGHGIAQTIQTDRPNQTEASSTVPAKSLQIESGLGFITMATTTEIRGTEYEGLNRQIIAPNTVFRLGLTEKIEFRVVSQIELNSNFNPRVSNPPYVSSFSDIQIGAKYQLYRKEGSKTEALILGHYSIPKGNTARQGEQFFGKLCVSHQLAENLNLGYNLGYRSTGVLDYFDYSCAISYTVTDKLSVFAEQYGNVNLSNAMVVTELDDLFGYDAGLAYLVTDRVQLDWVFGSGINIDMNFVSIGCSALLMK